MDTATMTEKEAFLYYMERMDIEMLDLILDDGRTYHNVDKGEFLKKLQDVFNDFKKAGDSALKIYKGGCSSNHCCMNLSVGYAFFGNNSGHYVDFIVDETDTAIIDIRFCYSFKIDSVYNIIEDKAFQEKMFCLKLPWEDENNYVKTEDYFFRKRICKQAMDEIMTGAITFLTKENYVEWVSKYNLFHWRLYSVSEYVELVEFFQLYLDLRYINGYVKGEKESEIALNEFATINTDNEKELLEWLLKYEDLSDDLISVRIECLCQEDIIKPGYYLLQETLAVYILTNDFINAVNFKKVYDKYGSPLYDKYFTICEAEIYNLSDHSEEWGNLSSLKNLLKKRGMIDENGNVVIE